MSQRLCNTLEHVNSKQITKEYVFKKLSHSKHEKNMLRHELAIILSLFKHKPHFKYMQNLPAKFHPNQTIFLQLPVKIMMECLAT